jgi:hypothetical protein
MVKKKVICVFFSSENNPADITLVHIFGSKKGALEFIKTIPPEKKPLYFLEDYEVIDV